MNKFNYPGSAERTYRVTIEAQKDNAWENINLETSITLLRGKKGL